MFPMRAQKLYEYYRAYPSLESVPASDREFLESKIFRCSLDEAWKSTRAFFESRDPSQIVKAEANPKFKMALLFRSYLGQASHWAKLGESGRRIDYQIWCGPAMAAFNDWVKGSPLEKGSDRRADLVASNILFGAAVLYRIRQLNFMGYRNPEWNALVIPRSDADLKQLLVKRSTL